jgi:hypothetical protein
VNLAASWMHHINELEFYFPNNGVQSKLCAKFCGMLKSLLGILNPYLNIGKKNQVSYA